MTPTPSRLARTVTTLACIAVALTASPRAQNQNTSPSRAQQPPAHLQTPTFRSGVQYVEVDVTVLDEKGRPVRDLTRDDFELLEDNVPQTIDSFRHVDIPLPPRVGAGDDRRPVPQDVTSNPDDGRVYVMLLDGGGAHLLRTRLVARRFITEALGPDDLMAIVALRSSTAMSHGFTRDKARLLSTVDRFAGERWLGVDEEVITVSERSGATGDAYRMISMLADGLGALGGRRKSILWVGGAPSFHHSGVRQAEEAFAQRDAIRAANRNNIAIYPIDPNGLTTALGEGELLRQAGFRAVAEDTGGDAIVNTNNFSGNYRRIVEQNSAYYLLGYVPADGADGRFHRIRVTVKRPGLRVRARTGYMATAAEPVLAETGSPLVLSERGQAALRSPLPVNGLPLEMFLAPFKGDGRTESVLLGATLRQTALKLDADARIEIAQIAVDPDGRGQGASASLFTVNRAGARPAQPPGATQAGTDHDLRYFTRLALPPGRHEVRLAVHQPGGQTGSLVGHVDVPDFRARALTMSGLVLSSLAGANHQLLSSDAVAVAALGGTPTATRAFGRSDTLSVWGEVYDNRREPAATLPVVSRIVSSTGTEVVSRSRVLSPSTDDGARTFTYRERFELGALAAGDYVLEVENRADRKRSVTRRVPFTVTP